MRETTFGKLSSGAWLKQLRNDGRLNSAHSWWNVTGGAGKLQAKFESGVHHVVDEPLLH